MTLPRRAPAAHCAVCGCPDRTTHDRRGAVCVACGAPWPILDVSTDGGER